MVRDILFSRLTHDPCQRHLLVACDSLQLRMQCGWKTHRHASLDLRFSIGGNLLPHVVSPIDVHHLTPWWCNIDQSRLAERWCPGVPPSGSWAAPRASASRGHLALIPDAPGPVLIRACPLRLPQKPRMCSAGAVLLFPSPYHGVLVVKSGAPPDGLRCAVLATVPGNPARATRDRHERQIARFPRTTCLPGLRRSLRRRHDPAGQAPTREHRAPHDDRLGHVRNTRSCPTMALSRWSNAIRSAAARRPALIA